MAKHSQTILDPARRGEVRYEELKSETAPCRWCDTDHARSALPSDRLQGHADDREAGHADPVASQRSPSLLAVEVEGARPTTAAAGRSATDCCHGSRECEVGRGADCRGTASQAWPLRVAADGAALHATGWATARSVSAQRWSTFVRSHASAMLAC